MTEEQFQLLNITDNWNVDEVPEAHWNKIPGLQRLHDTFSIMASGCATPDILNGQLASAGLDVLCVETDPKKGEPDGNAYHYVVQECEDGKYLIGPCRAETVVPHWFDADDLDGYWQD